MGRPERPIAPDAGPAGEFALRLRQLRDAAGKPSYRELARRASFSVTVLSEAAGGRTLPTLAVLTGYVRACGGDVAEWELRWRQAVAVLRESHDTRAGGAQARRPATAALPPPVTSGAAAAGMHAMLPRQLPAVVSPFVGRDRELEWLSLALGRTRIRGETPVITISGPAGVGKSALAVRWGHEVAGEFPDGQLYFNLRGFDPANAPVAPAQAICEFLAAMQVPAERVPPGLESQASLYRSMLAGRRMLVILDNARDSDQVRSLLPASSACVVVITSRNALRGLAATQGSLQLDLREFSQEEARELLAARMPGVAQEAEATAEIIRLCGRLPLALAIVAARSQGQRSVSITDLVAELREPPLQLDALSSGVESVSMREVFSWSYRNLTADAARLFALLAVHRGPDVSLPAAASLSGASRHTAGRLLAELTGAHLLTEPNPGRYAFHDLLRSYADEQARANVSAPDRDAAIRRVLDFYLHTAHSAARKLNQARDPIILTPASPGAIPESIGDREQALTWFHAEYQVLLEVIETASQTGSNAHAWQIPWCLVNFFDHEGRWHEWAATHKIACSASRRAGDRYGQAHTRQNLAIAYSHLQRHDDAHAQLRRALNLYRELGYLAGEARCRLDIARAFECQGRYQPALAEAQHALGLYRTLGHRAGTARSLNAIGWYCSHLGDAVQAVTHCEQALAIHRESGNRLGQAATWDSLGHAHTQLGQHSRAVSCYEQALRLLGEGERTYQRASVLRELGSTYRAAGDHPAAAQAWQEAKAIFADLHHPDASDMQTLIRAIYSGPLPTS